MGLSKTQGSGRKMSDLNVAALVGRLSRDSVIRTTAKGDKFCQFNVAVNRSRKREDGVWEDVPNFFGFALYGERAEKLSPYLVKGQTVSIQGHLVLDRWESQGVPHSRLDVTVDDLRLFGAAPAKKEADNTDGGVEGEKEEGGTDADPDLDLGGAEMTGESLL
jgi:single-strand DNA-binding protein